MIMDLDSVGLLWRGAIAGLEDFVLEPARGAFDAFLLAVLGQKRVARFLVLLGIGLVLRFPFGHHLLLKLHQDFAHFLGFERWFVGQGIGDAGRERLGI